jgi:hypothetical protein
MALTKITGNVLENNLEIPSVSSINNGPLAGFRNAIINGNFDIWQRGTSSSAPGYNTADRWNNDRVGTTTTLSRQSFQPGQSDVPGEPTYFIRSAVTSSTGSGNYSQIFQCIEGARTFAGQQVKVSFWAKSDATRLIAVNLLQLFGTGGSPSVTVSSISPTKYSLSTSWQKITHTVNVPSIIGKTLGSDGNDFLRLEIWFDAGSNFNSRTDSLGHQSGTFDIAQVQVEAGPVATPFERRPIGTELALCQRYYQIAYAGPFRKYAVNVIRENVPFTVVMRSQPTLSKTITSGVNIGTDSTGASERALTLDFQFTAGGTGVLDIGVYTVTASAEL